MITETHIKIFKDYGGDIDGFARASSLKEKAIMTDAIWFSIDSILQSLLLIEIGVAADSFIKDVDHKLKTTCDNENAIQSLKDMVPMFICKQTSSS